MRVLSNIWSYIQHGLLERVGLRRGSLIVDIGSNDGSCLSFFKEKGFRVCGVILPAACQNSK